MARWRFMGCGGGRLRDRQIGEGKGEGRARGEGRAIGGVRERKGRERSRNLGGGLR